MLFLGTDTYCLSHYGGAVRRKILFRDASVNDDASTGRDVKEFAERLLDQDRVAHVGHRAYDVRMRRDLSQIGR